LLLLLLLQLGNIVGEKESGLVTSLRHMGLLQSSYWASWVMYDLLMSLATALSIVMWGELLCVVICLHFDFWVSCIVFILLV
jgi:hypothetical protein